MHNLKKIKCYAIGIFIEIASTLEVQEIMTNEITDATIFFSPKIMQLAHLQTELSIQSKILATWK